MGMAQAFLSDINAVLPEVILLAGGCFILLFDLFITDKTKRYSFLLSCLLLIIVFVYSALEHPSLHPVAFGGQYYSDGFSVIIKMVSSLCLFMVFIYSRRYWCNLDYLNNSSNSGSNSGDIVKQEFYVLNIFCLLGAFIMISAGSLLVLYLGLELLSLPLYALIAMEVKNPKSSEAALKYFVMGAVASGVLLYGMSLIFGITHSLDLKQIIHVLSNLHQMSGFEKNVILLGFGFMIVAIAFKFGLVPFHMWVPDVYEGAPTPVTAVVGSIAKLAAFGFLFRLFIYGLDDLKFHWQTLFLIFGLLSVIIGNLGALLQTNIKRLFAYSTISHVGFLFLGLSCATKLGYDAAIFYMISYSLMTVGAFGVILLLQYKENRGAEIDDYIGLNRRHPWISFLMLLFLLSFAGIPPFVGFDGKLFVFAAMLDMHEPVYVIAVFIGLLMSVVGAYYYLKIIKNMYFDHKDPLDADIEPNRSKLKTSLVGFDGFILTLNGLFVFFAGVFPYFLVQISQYAAAGFG